MSRTINNIGLASDEYHIPVTSTDSSGFASRTDSCLVDKSETFLLCSDQVTDVECTAGNFMPNDTDCLADVNEVSCFHAKHVAQMAVAKSQQMVMLSEDTFGDDDFSTDSDS